MAETAEKDPAVKRSTAERLDALEHENLLLADAVAGVSQAGRWTRAEIQRLRAGEPEEMATA